MNKKRFSGITLLMLFLAFSFLAVGSINAAEPIKYLADLNPVSQSDGLWTGDSLEVGNINVSGVLYPKSIKSANADGVFAEEPGTTNTAEYNLGYKYEKLKGVAGVGDNSSNSFAKGRIKIYGDSALIYDSGQLALGSPQTVNINVSNVLRLKIEFVHINALDDYEDVDYVSLASPTLVIKDTTPPKIGLTSPKLSSDKGTSTTFPITYSVSDPAPASGIKSWKLQVKDGKGGKWSTWKTGSTGVLSSVSKYTGLKGKTYYFRLIATDKKYNVETSYTHTIVPYDDPSFSYSSGWGKWAYFKNYCKSTKYSSEKGSFVKFSFSGSAVYLIAPKSPNLGKANVYIDNIYRGTIDLYSLYTRYRRIVFSKKLNSGSHTIKVIVLDERNNYSYGTYVHIDGIGVKK